MLEWVPVHFSWALSDDEIKTAERMVAMSPDEILQLLTPANCSSIVREALKGHDARNSAYAYALGALQVEEDNK